MENAKKVSIKSRVKPAKMANMVKLMKLFIVPREVKPLYDSLCSSNSSGDAEVIDFFDDELFV